MSTFSKRGSRPQDGPRPADPFSDSAWRKKALRTWKKHGRILAVLAGLVVVVLVRSASDRPAPGWEQIPLLVPILAPIALWAWREKRRDREAEERSDRSLLDR